VAVRSVGALPGRLAPALCDARNPEVWRTNGRPVAQWSRIEAGRSDELA
jgi:hypothetical protein